jgi:formylmethanofuran dehydrogenase subunit B
MTQFASTTCPFCSLHCDDLRLEMEAGRLVRLSPECNLALAGYENISTISIFGKKLDQNEDYTMAEKWLNNSSRPLIILAGDADQNAVRAAIRLAKKINAVLCTDDCNAGNILSLAMKSCGLMSGTLGELRASASQIILLGVDPTKEMPRFWDYLSPEQKEKALSIDIDDPLETIRNLRLALRFDGKAKDTSWKTIAEKIPSAPGGVILFGPDWLQDGLPLISELLLWLNELSTKGRWYALPVVSEPNRVGQIETLLLETGYSGSMQFLPGGVNFDPCEFQSERLMDYDKADVIILVGNLNHLDTSSVRKLDHYKGKVMKIGPEPPDGHCDLWLSSTRPGYDAPGEMSRLDGVPVILQPVAGSDHLTVAEIIDRIIRGVDA